jgi:hypothetical protein
LTGEERGLAKSSYRRRPQRVGQRRSNALAPGNGKELPMQGQRMRGESAKQVAVDVLRKAGRPLQAKEIAKRVIESGRCAGLKGKTPEATISAMLAVGSKPGGPFKRVEKGTYTLAAANGSTRKPAAGKKRAPEPRAAKSRKKQPTARGERSAQPEPRAAPEPEPVGDREPEPAPAA